MSADQVIAARAALAGENSIPREDAVAKVYSHLLIRHLFAMQRDPNGADRKRLYDLIEALRVEFPSEIKVWDDLYSPEGGAK
nr:hypothetical protein [Mesorhizobium sp.]